MCTVSMIMDHYTEKWQQVPYWPPPQPSPVLQIISPQISQEEIAEFRRLLERAREYDKRMNVPDCELDSKKQTLVQLAKQLGVEILFL